MLRKLITALILVPLAVLLVAFAVANRQSVIVSFDPFDASHPAFALAVPLFALLLAALLAGVVIGGVAAWMRQSRWRRDARFAQGQARALHAELEELKERTGTPMVQPGPARYATALRIPPSAA
jgi:uncharacterized integral membrane protein